MVGPEKREIRAGISWNPKLKDMFDSKLLFSSATLCFCGTVDSEQKPLFKRQSSKRSFFLQGMVGAVWESESCCDDALYKGNIAGLSCTRNR